MTNKTETRNKGKAENKKLKLKKETLKDLDAKKAKGIRGGMLFLSLGKGECAPAQPVVEFKTPVGGDGGGKGIGPLSENCCGK